MVRCGRCASAIIAPLTPNDGGGVRTEPGAETNTFWHAGTRNVRLRAPDALHLAIAARYDCVVATLDADMAAVACDLGLEVVIP